MASTMRANRNRSSSSDSSSAVDMSSCTAVAKPPTRSAGLQQAQTGLLVLPFGQVTDPGADPAQCVGNLGRDDHAAGEGGQPAGRRRDLPLQQVEDDGPAGRTGHGGVGQRGPELGVGQHELLNRLEVGRQPAERGRTGLLGDGGRVALKRGVH